MPAFQLQSMYSNAAPQFKQHNTPCRLFLYHLCSLKHTCLRQWMGANTTQTATREDYNTREEVSLHRT